MWLAEALYKKRSKWCGGLPPICGCSSMVELRSSTPVTWVRFPSPAPNCFEYAGSLPVKEDCAMATEDSEPGFVEFSRQFYRESVQLLFLILRLR